MMLSLVILRVSRILVYQKLSVVIRFMFMNFNKNLWFFQGKYTNIRLKIHKYQLCFLLYLHLYITFNIFYIIVLLQTSELYSFIARTIGSKIDCYYLLKPRFYIFVYVRKNVADYGKV